MRLIDADLPRGRMESLYEHHLEMCNFSADGAVYDCLEILDEAPTVDAEPVVHGHWIDDGVWDVCSVCGRAFLKVHLNGNPTFNYCPNCGAKMNEEDE